MDPPQGIMKPDELNNEQPTQTEFIPEKVASLLFFCQECFYSTSSVSSLKQHVTKMHLRDLAPTEKLSISVDPENIPKQRKPYLACKFCEFLAENRKSLRSHWLEAGHAINFLYCPYCDYWTTAQINLRSHVIWKHTKRCYHKCPQCSHRSMSFSKLKQHVMKNHPKVKLLACPFCNFRTNLEESLESHLLAKHTNLQFFLCPHCDFRALSSNHLKEHTDKLHPTVNRVYQLI